jgi:hypothetical protein
VQRASVDELAKSSALTGFQQPRLYLAVHRRPTYRRGDVGCRAAEAALVLVTRTIPFLVTAILTLNITNDNGALRQTDPVGDSSASNPAF